jgi:hypothetical protein
MIDEKENKSPITMLKKNAFLRTENKKEKKHNKFNIKYLFALRGS